MQKNFPRYKKKITIYSTEVFLMKLTKERLYQLIKEQMEEKQYGKDFQSFLQIPIGQYMRQDYSLDIPMLESIIGPKIGSGYSRMVFEIDDSYVAKIAYKDPNHWDANSFNDGCKSNRLEYQKFNMHPDIFPKSFGIFKKDSVLVVERVTVIETQDHMDRVLRNAYPTLVEAAQYLASQGYPNTNPSWVFERILDTWDEVIGDSSPIRRDEFDDIMQKKRAMQGVGSEQLDALWNIVTRDTKLMYWVSSLREMGVEFDEIRFGNVATNAMENKLILIDISKFDFASGTELEKKSNNKPYDHRVKNMETDPELERVRPFVYRRKIQESLNPNHEKKLLILLNSNPEDATMAIELMSGLGLSDQEIKDWVLPQLPALILKSIDFAKFAIRTMSSLGMSDQEIFNMLVKSLRNVTNIPLRRFLREQINIHMAKAAGLYDV